ncbi:Lj965 prophage terminase large subunit [Weissella koreensis KACC 15510]|nr:Lj965 prophage terminase large subunit [Weissella koreensis KACC 15510]
MKNYFLTNNLGRNRRKRGEDKPVKEHDHSMDAIRYFVFMVLYKNRTVKVSDKPSGLFG